MDLYGVIGRPILHSRSPQMFNAAFTELGLDSLYLRVSSTDLEHALGSIRSLGIKGFNVTAPYKELIVEHMDEVVGSPVNTVVVRDGKLIGHNTDPAGVKGALVESGKTISNAAIIGAGGAARSAAMALIEMEAEVTIVNRTAAKAEALARDLGCSYGEVGDVDAIVSCISAPAEMVPASKLHPDLVVMDAYYATETPLMRDAKAAGCTIIDGRRWLFHHGLKVFELFKGLKAPGEAMEAALSSSRSGTNINLLGPMGVGKSTIGQELSTIMEREFVETDKLVEERAGMEIIKIFLMYGKDHFRELESEVVTEVGKKSNLVVSCGGGVMLDPANINALSGHNILLWASAQTLIERVGNEETRPLIEGDDKEEKVRSILKERTSRYMETNHLVVNTDGLTAEQTAQQIAFEVKGHG